MQSIYRERSTHTVEVDGNEFTCVRIEMMDYNGEWISHGFRVTLNGVAKHYMGYPTPTDLKKFDTMPDFTL